MIKHIGNCTLINASSFRELPKFADNAIQWCVTSPPYNFKKSYSKVSSVDVKYTRKYENWYEDDKPEQEYQFEQIILLDELMRVCSESIFYNHVTRYVWGDNKVVGKIIHPLEWLMNFPIWSEIVWNKRSAGTPTGRYQVSNEHIYQIGRPSRFQKSVGISNVWTIPPSQATGHVCPFPLQVVLNCLAPHALKGETVIDPYMGSGTVGIACIDLGLSFVGIEFDPKTFDNACNRIEKHFNKHRSGLGLVTNRYNTDSRKRART